MKAYRILALAGILGIAILLAFPLRDTVYEAVIVPLAYVLWILGLAYHSVHQALWWFAVLFFVLIIFSRSFLPRLKDRERAPLKARPSIGQVESLALWMKKAEKGIYFRWLIANRLGKIAYYILSQRDAGKSRSVFAPLAGADWDPQEQVQAYLETGLHGSFTDYPQPVKLFSPPVKTPLDVDVKDAVEFLESQLGN
jgi:hypothetical protein